MKPGLIIMNAFFLLANCPTIFGFVAGSEFPSSSPSSQQQSDPYGYPAQEQQYGSYGYPPQAQRSDSYGYPPRAQQYDSYGYPPQDFQNMAGEDSNSYKGSIRFNSPDLVLNPMHVITSTPTVRDYTFVITNQTGAPDGFLRTMLVINGQYPAPLIEANEGDTINVKVINQMGYPVSIHWHGMYQRNTPWMDGISGVTQCPIPPSDSFTYTFQVLNQFGTFWYHAHTGNLKADGIAGPLIVHSTRDPLVRGRDFDSEMVVFVSDWYHDTSTYIMQNLLSLQGYNGSFAAPSPSSVILNGIGFYDCERYAPGQQCQTIRKPLELRVAPQSKTRIRFIQSGSRSLFRLSVDNHPLEIIEADATPVKSLSPLERIQIHAGERYSVILDTHSDKEGDSFYLRAAVDTDCLAWLAPGMETAEMNTGKAVIRVTQKRRSHQNELQTSPTTYDWKSSSMGPCYDVNSTFLTPRIKPDGLDEVKGRVFFNHSFGTVTVQDGPTDATPNILGRFFVDNTSYISHLDKPLLHHMLQGGKHWLNASEIATETLPEAGVWDIVLNNLDQALEHPFHLHGVDSCRVATGSGILDEKKAMSIKYNTETPVCRDVHVLPAGTYSVFRVHTNPGVWFWHCHMGWHLGAGFAGAVVMEPDEVAKMRLPPANQALCQAASRRSSQGMKNSRDSDSGW